MDADTKLMAERWNYFWILKQGYYNGYEEIDLVVFTELVEDTYCVIKEMRQYIDSKKYENVEPNDIYWYIEMISIMARYAELPCMDESKNYVYTATALLATEIVNIASIDSWNSKLRKGIIEAVPGEDYGISKKIKYDIHNGDITGFLDIANEMMK